MDVSSSEASFGWGIITGNPGENIGCGDVRNRFLLEVTYTDGSRYHCLPCQVKRVACQDPPELAPLTSPRPNSGFVVLAVAMDGGEHFVHGLTPDALVLHLRQHLAKQLGQHSWSLVKLSVSGDVPTDTQMLSEVGLVGASASVSFVVMPKDRRSWQWSMARLLHALRRNDDVTASGCIEEAVRANRKYHLVHVVKSVCLAGEMQLLDALAERVSAEVLCQALVMNRGSIDDRYRQRGACVFYALWEFHFESFKSLCMRLHEGQMLTKLLAMNGGVWAAQRGDVWASVDPEALAWAHPLRAQSREELLTALEDPAHQPQGWKQRRLDFLADLQTAGFSFRDLAVMCSVTPNHRGGERLTPADCMMLPDELNLVFLKWTRSSSGNVTRRPGNWEEFPENPPGYICSFLDAFISKAAVVSMSDTVPDGKVWLYGDPSEKEQREALFLKQVAAGKVLHSAKSADLVATVSAYPSVSIKLWSLHSGSCVQTFSTGLCASSVTFSRDSAFVLSADSDCVARLWSLVDGSCQRTFEHSQAKMNFAVFSTDDTLVLTASSDGTAKIWSVEDGAHKQSLLSNRLECSGGHEDGLNSAVFAVDNELVLTASDDGTAKLWRLRDGVCVQSFTGHASEVNAATLSVDKAMVLTGGYDGCAKLWRAQGSTWSCEQTFNAGHDELHSVVISPDNALALTAGYSGEACLWGTGDGVLRWSLAHGSGLYTASFLADGEFILTAGGNNTQQAVKLWSVAAGCCMRTFRCGDPNDQGGSGCSMVVAFSSSSGLLMTALNRGLAKVWNVEDGSCSHTFEHHKEEEGVLKAVALTGACA